MPRQDNAVIDSEVRDKINFRKNQGTIINNVRLDFATQSLAPAAVRADKERA